MGCLDAYTWCPPCREEIPDLNVLSARFGRQGLVILAISNEEVPVLKKFLVHRHMRFPVLLDPGDSVRKLFRVRGIPHSFIYDRGGDMVAQAIDRPGRQGFLEMLGKAGLR